MLLGYLLLFFTTNEEQKVAMETLQVSVIVTININDKKNSISAKIE